MAQNAVSNKLEFKNLLREHASSFPVFGNYIYWILILHDSMQDLFSLSQYCVSSDDLLTYLLTLYDTLCKHQILHSLCYDIQ